jgi:hypothetical protein
MDDDGFSYIYEIYMTKTYNVTYTQHVDEIDNREREKEFLPPMA